MTFEPDWRIEEGSAIADPLTFDFTVLEVDLCHFRGGRAVPSIICEIKVQEEVLIEGIDQMMHDIDGRMVITYTNASQMAGDITLNGNCGCLSLLPFPSILLQIHLDHDHFGLISTKLSPNTSGSIEIEFGTIYHQSAEPNFWNVAQSPVVLFDEFRLRIGT